MAIPKQVDEAAILAEELHNKMFSTGDTDQDTDDYGTDDTSDIQDDFVDEPTPTKQDSDEDLSFKQKYLTLKGMYDTQVPQLQTELKEFKQAVFSKLGQTTQTQDQQEPPKTNTKLDQFREEYGDDFVDSLKELFKAEIDPLFKERLQPVQQQVASVEETQVKVAQENFIGYLDQVVKGNWKDAWSGNDPKFYEFLQKSDPSGLYTYGDLVNMYNDNWDADKLAKVFNTYYGENQQTTRQPIKKPQQDALVAPNRNSTHSTPNTEDKRIWTSDLIKQFEKDDRAGRYKPEDSKLMWDDLLSAMSEGRIRS